MKILMVCLGNICRSPIAEGVLQTKLNSKGLDIKVDSAGTGGWHAGQAPDPRSIAIANKYGIDISNQQARQFSSSDFESFDIIYAMDGSNLSDIVSLANSNEDIEKVRLILNEISPEDNTPVPDPYYGGDDGFEKVYQLLDAACEIITKKIS
uniref:protein-tyrosine-phosphatase n=1 Tax=uncultured Cytophagia bacterium TaxID=768505 RepID=H6RE88_9BACT|nr:protein tyrosine phosphatase [uncultured bacterium]CCF99349.1 low molecular weight phosphotyrosine protein phosphatase [uncultured Cytophagia bacterium]